MIVEKISITKGTIKRTFSAVMAFLVIATSLLIPTFAVGNTSEFEYEINSGEVTITGNNCDDYDKITIPEKIEGYSVTKIGTDAFAECEASEISIPNTVVEICYSAFLYCTNLTSITIPSSVTSIASYAFSDCTNLEGITFGESSQLTSIGDGAFCWCNSLKSVTIPDSVTNIGGVAFVGCTSLENIAIPDSVTNIGISAFEGTAYSNNEANWENDVLYIGNHLIGAKETISGSYTVKDGTKTIADYAFYECKNLENITLPNSVTSIGNSAFEYCTSLEIITVGSNNKNYSSDEYGVLFNKDKTELLRYPSGNSRTSYTIPNSVTSIGDWAFKGCTSLESITIPDSVTSIGNSAFEYCTSLASVTIGNSVTSIGDNAFEDCSNLKNLTFGKNSKLKSVGKRAFAFCKFKNITIPDGVTVIGDGAFVFCENLETITLPDSVTKIGGSAFDMCNGLKSISVGSGNLNYTTDEYGVLFNKDKTELIRYPSGNSRISYVISNTVTSIGYGAFYLSESLENVTIPDKVTSIGDDAFEWCESIKDVYYSGAESEWSAITIGGANECLTGATIHYDYKKPAESTTKPAESTTKPAESTTKPTASTTKPAASTTKPTASTTKPTASTTKPAASTTKSAASTTKPSTSTTTPTESTTMPTMPTTRPTVPTTISQEPTPDAKVVGQPSQTSIDYGDSIDLHVDSSKIPVGGYVVWTADNGNFDYSVSVDGLTCKITPKSSGTTTFTATIYNQNSNIVSYDTQPMKSKAGIFKKIGAFFKKIFKRTKHIPMHSNTSFNSNMDNVTNCHIINQKHII